MHKQGSSSSSKCFVLVLAAFVILCALVLIFSSLVLRVRTPLLQFKSASVNHITHSTSPSPSLNLTMIAHLTITNPNFGSFYYEKSNVSVLLGGTTVGDRELGRARVKARETQAINVTLSLSSNTANLTNDTLFGTLKLSTYAKLTGTLHLLNILHKKKTTEMACTMINLNLTSHSIHNFPC